MSNVAGLKRSYAILREVRGEVQEKRRVSKRTPLVRLTQEANRQSLAKLVAPSGDVGGKKI